VPPISSTAIPTSERIKNLKNLRYIARQPIFDRDEKVFGYELFFRNGMENAFSAEDADAASRSTLDSSLLMGLDMLCDGRRAFLNRTRETLVRGLITLMPPNSTVVEILESVPPDAEVMSARQHLKEAGYLIALDDYVNNDPREAMVELADIMKVDLKRTTQEDRAALVKRHGPWRCRMLAEKVETRAEFVSAREMGFVYFQGYFFRKLEIVATRDVPANRLNYMRLIGAVSRNDLDMVELEKLVKGETSICYRLLRYLNSAMFGFKSEIHSVRHALSILGEREVRRWVRLVAAVEAGQDKPSDLVLSALVRARFGELLSPQIPHGESDLFLLGLRSLIDAMLETLMPMVLEKIPLDQDTKAVLLGQTSRLRPVYQLMLAHESGQWDAVAELCKNLHLDTEDTASSYWQAQQWASDVASGA
jgi:EAL and modified HD-GYP domain-containing signal transduction protein